MNETDAYARQISLGVRQALASHYRVSGAEFGYKLARRIVADVSAEVVEVHGRRAGYDLLMRASDRLVHGRLLDEDGAPLATVLEGEEPTPGIIAAIARHEAEPSITWRPESGHPGGRWEVTNLTMEELMATLSIPLTDNGYQVIAPAPPPAPLTGWAKAKDGWRRFKPAGWFLAFWAGLVLQFLADHA
jgi:hypothetical protein